MNKLKEKELEIISKQSLEQALQVLQELQDNILQIESPELFESEQIKRKYEELTEKAIEVGKEISENILLTDEERTKKQIENVNLINNLRKQKENELYELRINHFKQALNEFKNILNNIDQIASNSFDFVKSAMNGVNKSTNDWIQGISGVLSGFGPIGETIGGISSKVGNIFEKLGLFPNEQKKWNETVEGALKRFD